MAPTGQLHRQHNTFYQWRCWDAFSSKDYNFLFSAIDIDGNGTVNFAEFCAFFASLPAQNESFNGDELKA